ncbi:hypothetical protein M231_03009 [Tremella mesenterica]|uniref:Uncharacterized protein n=2 Tax=Tremella mesenterica TaxID=5217 RepID=A0A4Q1BP34_TREME|nr:hypothetical protein M231_03009 [Tremella mesenterica]
MPNHLPTLIVTPHGQPNSVLYTYLHTEENRVNYLLTPSPQGDLCVAKLFPPHHRSSTPNPHSKSANVVRCEASRDLKWTIENTGVVSPIYKIVNQDDTPLYQISKPNPNAEFWTMFYFKYAGHQIPPKRIEFGKVAKNPPEKGGGTRISITGKTEDEKQVWQTLGVGNEDCVEWVVCCACLNLLDDQILHAAEKKAHQNPPASSSAPASTAPRPPGPASTLRPTVPRTHSGPSPSRTPVGPGIASTVPVGIQANRNPPSFRGDARQVPPNRPGMPPPVGSQRGVPIPPRGSPAPIPNSRPGTGGTEQRHGHGHVLHRPAPQATGRRF